MTDHQIIERLATEVMGWEKINKNGKTWWELPGGKFYELPYFNPITDWNHTMDVVGKVMLNTGVDQFAIGINYVERKLEDYNHGDKIFSVPWTAIVGTGRGTDMSMQMAVCFAALDSSSVEV